MSPSTASTTNAIDKFAAEAEHCRRVLASRLACAGIPLHILEKIAAEPCDNARLKLLSLESMIAAMDHPEIPYVTVQL